ncbi:MAG: nucleotidyltransferase family protein [Candidatus Omnitrophica bacterium]|nr:nucleotidyltransferase family protein [Candidatus Omnitrophota bacterium]
MKAVILAAGYATRLYPLTLNIPKCLLQVRGKAILESLCEKLAPLREIDEILIVTNARFYGQLESWSRSAASRRDAWAEGATVRVLNDGSVSNETRLGAAGDLRFAAREANLRTDILMLASDNLFEEGLRDFMDFSLKAKDSVCIGLHDIGDRSLAAKKFGVVEVDQTFRVTGMEEKPEHPRSSLIGMGIYFLPAKALARLDEYLASPGAQDAPGFYIRWLFEKGVEIRSFLFRGMWYDIGDFQALEEANKRNP